MKIKLFLLAFLVAPIFLSSFTASAPADISKQNHKFYVLVDIPNLPQPDIGSYAKIEVINTEFNTSFIEAYAPTVTHSFIQPVGVYTFPGEASVKFRTNGIFSGTVRVRVIVFNSNGEAIYSQTSGVSGIFGDEAVAHVIVQGKWTILA